MQSRDNSVAVSRVGPGIYQIGEKQVTLKLEGESNQLLKVRVGSTWIDFDTFMNQAKARLGVDQDDEEEKKDDAKIGADLDDSAEASSASAAGKQAKSKKKKKKKEKKAAMELDLDMDDDAAKLTRFGAVTSAAASTEDSQGDSGQSSPTKDS